MPPRPSTRDAQPLRPYGTWAIDWLDAGWSPIPLPRGQKAPVPDGYTGWDGKMASRTKVREWAKTHSDGNIALRLPPGVIGIDSDVYDTKRGDLTIATIEAERGELPDTFRLTARGFDNPGGVRLYRLPESARSDEYPEGYVRFVGKLGPGVEVIQFGHRYCLPWPSWNPKSQSLYRIYDDRDGTELEGAFDVTDLPELPEAWVGVQAVTRDAQGRLLPGQTPRKGTSRHLDKSTHFDADQTRAWLAEHNEVMCRAMRLVLKSELAKLTEAAESGESRYDTARDAVMALVRQAQEGHHGARSAVVRMRKAYEEAVEGERNRDKTEWSRMVIGAVAAVAGHEDRKHATGACPTPHDNNRDPSIWPAPTEPYEVARRFADEHFSLGEVVNSKATSSVDLSSNAVRVLTHWRDDFYRWTGAHWTEHPASDLTAMLYATLHRASYAGAAETPTELRWKPDSGKVNRVLHALGALTQRGDGTDEDHGGVICFANGVLDLSTREFGAASAARFNLSSLPYDFAPVAGLRVSDPAKRARAVARSCPQWIEFLTSLWPEDEQSVALLQEWFGYVLSGSTAQQKIGLLVGPPRSGKGVISRVLTALAGRENVTSPTLASLATNFGLAPLIGKSLGLIADARFAGQNVQTVVERLLTISGEDSLSIDRKNREAWEGRLGARLMVVSNEVPSLAESSGALAARFIGPLVTRRSWLGNEDLDLEERLVAELPGVLAWSLDGLDRLEDQGRFTVVASALGVRAEMEESMSGVKGFMRECAARSRDESVPRVDLYGAYRVWCEQQGRRVPTLAWFFRDLRAAYPEIEHAQVTVEKGRRERVVLGVVLRDEWVHDPR